MPFRSPRCAADELRMKLAKRIIRLRLIPARTNHFEPRGRAGGREVFIEHELRPYCGQPLDIIYENGLRRSNRCTNEDCPGNSAAIGDGSSDLGESD